MTTRKTAEIPIPEEYRDKYPYFSIYDCPLFHALRDHGYKVRSVGGLSWTDEDRRPHTILNDTALYQWAKGKGKGVFVAVVEVPDEQS